MAPFEAKKTSINRRNCRWLVKNLFSSRMVAKTYFSFARSPISYYHWYLSAIVRYLNQIQRLNFLRWMTMNRLSMKLWSRLISSRVLYSSNSFSLIHRSFTFTLNLLWLYLKIRIPIKFATRNLISIQGHKRKILAHRFLRRSVIRLIWLQW